MIDYSHQTQVSQPRPRPATSAAEQGHSAASILHPVPGGNPAFRPPEAHVHPVLGRVPRPVHHRVQGWADDLLPRMR